MKRTIAILFSVLLLTGCGSNKLAHHMAATLPLVKGQDLLSNKETPKTTTSEVITTTIPTTTSTTTTSTITTTTTMSTTMSTTTKKVTTTKKKTTTTKKATKKTTTKAKITTPVDLTEEKAYQILMDLKKEYPEGKYWNDETYSSFHGGNYSGGWGCVGITYMASDRIFGNLPVTRITDFSKIRVGDIFRYQYGYGHSVIVLEVKSDRIVVGEGNWQDSVHWGREITFDFMKKHGKYIYTRWPQ